MEVPRPRAVLRGHTSGIGAAAFIVRPSQAEPRDSDYLVLSGDVTGRVMGWNPDTRECVYDAPAALKSAACDIVPLQVQDVRALLRDKTGRLIVWRETGMLELRCAVAPGFGKAGWNGHDLVALVAGDSANQVQLLDVHNDSIVSTFSHPAGNHSSELGMITAVSFCDHNKDLLCVAHESGALCLWSVRAPATFQQLAQVQAGSDPLLSCVTYRDRCATGGASANIGVYNTSKFTQSARIALRSSGVSQLAWRPDGKLLAAGCWDGHVRIFDGRVRTEASTSDEQGSLADPSLRRLAVLKYHTQSTTCVAFSPDSRSLLSASQDAKVALWALYPPAS
ncbi:Protein DECREASED SIZE EXCLUSION LIMIT 1 [Porphyridium purpureum]|uniref:Protein DECREASED SIZE EXCLUSION LIMIT 1 n=1 Tax=Porphyridium purpureum TaxID=35688 RepID=A0A5J4YVI6_PORPP|nr:Protein DECREASED SIZE EXCLUSION LIMIT 1 [Porphyridium purpureum]|eukprot:POR5132..scf227_4